MSRFPITVWPATPLESVAVQRREFEVDDDGVLLWGRLLEPQELPEEWVLRQLLRTNLDDDHEILATMENYGAVTDGFPGPRCVPVERHALLGWPSDTKIEDVRWALKTVRALVCVWRETQFDRPVAAAWTAEAFVPPGKARAWSEVAAWDMFTHSLNDGLRAFHARIEHDLIVRYSPKAPIVFLYSAACRQIFNLIVEDGTARVCENETCSVVFVRQIGSAKFGQYRTTGVQYCSPECARMQAQRQYRRREKEKKRGSK